MEDLLATQRWYGRREPALARDFAEVFAAAVERIRRDPRSFPLAITIVDREALDDDALLFRREGVGWPRLNKLFGGELETVLHRFQEAVWEAA